MKRAHPTVRGAHIVVGEERLKARILVPLHATCFRSPPKYEMRPYEAAQQAFIVEVPELLGCAADGQTYQDAVQNVEVVIQEWIETAQALWRSIPEPKGRLLFA